MIDLLVPKIDWSEVSPNRWLGTCHDFDMSMGLRNGGEDRGTWSAIMNGGSLTCGYGPHGYSFHDKEHAQRSLEAEMVTRLKAKLVDALFVLQTYTRADVELIDQMFRAADEEYYKNVRAKR